MVIQNPERKKLLINKHGPEIIHKLENKLLLVSIN